MCGARTLAPAPAARQKRAVLDTETFVLLDDARSGGRARLFRDPRDIVVARQVDEVDAALDRLRALTAAGRHVAGYLAYGASPGIDGAAVARRAGDDPLLWFGVFDGYRDVDPAAVLPDPAGAYAGPPRPSITAADYHAAVREVQALIAAGDIYQANLSFRARVPIAGDPRAVYARLRAAAAAGWGAIVRHDGRWLLSLSPESFFTIDGGRITARPMKGTRPRGRDQAEDARHAADLTGSAKERAENLMIVDLLRNDLSRIAVPGSVRVPALFEVETYPTVLQMVSTVEADLADGRDAIDAVRALFPCGSITGAPKLRATEVIAAVEADARGVYTGAIGAIGPDGSAAFNVAIRTLDWREGDSDDMSGEATFGLGSAIVADSVAEDEWRECLAKGAFVTAGQTPFDLLETMRIDPVLGIFELERHLARLSASAAALGFTFDRHDARNDLHAATFRAMAPSRVRLRVAAGGARAVEVAPLPRARAEPVEVAIVPLPVSPDDFRLRHKTSDRGFYDRARAAAGTFEVVFERPDGSLTEGSFTTLFKRRADGMLLTPPLGAGLQPGVLRASLLDAGQAIEARLTRADLTGGFLLGNALRGLIGARLAREVAGRGTTSL